MSTSTRKLDSEPERQPGVERLERGEQELVALGAALGSNCVLCTEHHIAEARKTGFSPRQLEEAIRLADHVRRTPARKVLAAALRALSESVGPAAAPSGGSAGSAEEDEQRPAAAADNPDDSPTAKGSRPDRRCRC